MPRLDPPEKTEVEIIFDVPDAVINAAVDELVTLLNLTFAKIHRERKLDARVSLSIVRAVTARMWTTLSDAERAHSQQMSRKLIQRMKFLVIPGGVRVQ